VVFRQIAELFSIVPKLIVRCVGQGLGFIQPIFASSQFVSAGKMIKRSFPMALRQP
jgi:hypothetical protein